MTQILEKRKSKEIVLKAFAFRCLWETKDGETDGFTYAVSKHKLASEIYRRSKACEDKALDVKVVQVDVNFTFFIEKQKGQIFSTLSEKHKQDLSKD